MKLGQVFDRPLFSLPLTTPFCYILGKVVPHYNQENINMENAIEPSSSFGSRIF